MFVGQMVAFRACDERWTESSLSFSRIICKARVAQLDWNWQTDLNLLS